MLNGTRRRATVLTHLRDRAERSALKQAIAAPGRPPATSRDLLASVDDLSGILRRFGAEPGARIAIVSSDALFTATAMLMASDIGTGFPVDPRLKRPELEAALAQPGLWFIVCDAEAPEYIAEIGREAGASVLRFDHAPDAPAGRLRLLDATPARAGAWPFFDACDSVVVLPTSGTTAAPRWVGWTSEMIVRAAGPCHRSPVPLGSGSLSRHHAALPRAWPDGLSVRAAALGRLGYPARWLRCRGIPRLARRVQAELVVGGAVDAQIDSRACQSHGEAARSAVDPVGVGGVAEPWRRQIEDGFGASVIEALGLTEATHQVASNRIGTAARKPGSVGQPLGVEILVRRDDGGPAAAGEPGQLLIRGPTVVTRYLGRDGGDGRDKGWLPTGDIVCRDGDGDLFVIGRTKELIRRSGESVSPYEVESVLLAHPAVDQVAVFGRPHDLLGETVAAAYVARPGYAPAPADVRSFAAERLAAFKVPASIRQCATLPFDARGKIRRSELAGQIPASQEVGLTAPPTLS